MKSATKTWQDLLYKCYLDYDYEVAPRGSKVREVIAGQYSLQMPAYLNLKDRNVNYAFMFAEAAWIIEGSNQLSKITPYMKNYAKFSDDNVFLRGGYGPKIVDQLGYVVDSLYADTDSRQAVLNIWRERPGHSKDIPCTLSMQFLIREGKLNAIVTMRSQDIVLGFTYDIFTFSMIAKAVQLLYNQRVNNYPGEIELGNLYVTAGSLHLYETHYDNVNTWYKSKRIDSGVKETVDRVLRNVSSYDDLIKVLWLGARQCKYA